jgi:hypothetical protein
MAEEIRQVLTVQSSGVLEVRSPALHCGDRAEVTIVLMPAAEESSPTKTTETGGWRRFAGAVNSGNPNAGDNESIDADLAREYMGDTDGPEATP